MSLEGALAISVAWDGRRVRTASIESSRPVGAARALVGRRPDDAVATVPLLFAICGRSQAVAAALACERASGIVSAASVTRARAELVDAESVHEYLWRTLLDWPRATGEPGEPALLGEARRLLADGVAAYEPALAFAPGQEPPQAASRWREARARLGALVAERILGARPQDWNDPQAGRARFDAWVGRGASASARLLGRLAGDASAFAPRRVPLMSRVAPEALAAAIVPRMDAEPAFAAAPDWKGGCRETGALARQHAHPLIAALDGERANPVIARLAARLVELGALLDGEGAPRFGSAALGDGDAIAWVETARGLLLHRVAVADDVVTRYQIVAPTEWNFHPRGPLVAELPGLAAPDADRLRERVDVLVQSLDPCVAYDVRIERGA